MSTTVERIDNQCVRCKGDGKGTYLTYAACDNCGWRGEAVHSLTHEKGGLRARCPRCECRTVRMGGFIERSQPDPACPAAHDSEEEHE